MFAGHCSKHQTTVLLPTSAIDDLRAHEGGGFEVRFTCPCGGTGTVVLYAPDQPSGSRWSPEAVR